jgi:hypothetical protein
MEWNKYVTSRARELAECRTSSQAKEVIQKITTEIEQSGFTQSQERTLWREILQRYEQEPKPLEEAISARSLNQLQAAVQHWLRDKSGQ